MRYGKCVLPLFCFGLSVSILVMTLLGVSPQTVLIGLTEKAPPPVASTQALLGGDFMNQLQSYYSDEFPLRSYFIKAYNQLNYWIGGKIGDYCKGDGQLFQGTYYNAFLQDAIPDDQFAQFISDAKEIREQLEGRGKHFFVVLTPNKAEVYSDKLPWYYRAAQRASDGVGAGHRKTIEALQAANIPYYDATSLMIDLRNNGMHQPFPPTGAHWNQYAAAWGSVGLVDAMRAYGAPVPEMTALWQETDYAIFEERDLQMLLNVYYSELTTDYVFARVERVDANADKPSAFAETTSFSHSLDILYHNGENPFSVLERQQYSQFQNIVRTPEEEIETLPGVPIADLDYASIVNDHDIIYIETVAGLLPESHADFASCLLAYLKANPY